VRVRMKQRIGGYRNGEPWPEPGASIDVPDHEADDLITQGYAAALTDVEHLAELDVTVTVDGVDVGPPTIEEFTDDATSTGDDGTATSTGDATGTAADDGPSPAADEAAAPEVTARAATVAKRPRRGKKP
jgi:hypothetical protein